MNLEKSPAKFSNRDVLHSSEKMDWETPDWLFQKLNKEFNFTLDPCASVSNAKTKKFFTEKENGLIQDWSKEIVFMNPPYGNNSRKWIEKAYFESKRGATVVCLIVSRTDTSYWHDFIFPYATQFRFFRGRIGFGDSKTSPIPSVIVIFSNKNYPDRIIWDYPSKP